jgi:murein DD-endopeptidase MepM/ murein hydrolase activator NlpD
VAARFNVPVDEVRLANQLSSDNILVGQSLTVPSEGELTAAAVPSRSAAMQTSSQPHPTTQLRPTSTPVPTRIPRAQAARPASATATPTPKPPAPAPTPKPALPTPAPVARSGPAASIPGGISWPLRGVITQRFGENGHTGLDIADPTGTAVRAAAPGVVSVAAKATYGYGWRIIIDHGNGYSTLYAHLSAFNVAAGATVARGQVIGAVGQTGLATGPHLHFEVRVNGQANDPLKFLP